MSYREFLDEVGKEHIGTVAEGDVFKLIALIEKLVEQRDRWMRMYIETSMQTKYNEVSSVPDDNELDAIVRGKG